MPPSRKISATIERTASVLDAWLSRGLRLIGVIFGIALAVRADEIYSVSYTSGSGNSSVTETYSVSGRYTIYPSGPGTIEIAVTSSGTGGYGGHYMEYDVGTNLVPPFFFHYNYGAPGVSEQVFVQDTVNGISGYSIDGGVNTNGTTQNYTAAFSGTPGATVTINDQAYEWNIVYDPSAGENVPSLTGGNGGSTTYVLPPANPLTPPNDMFTPDLGPTRFNFYPRDGGDPVDVTTGEFTQSHVDLHVNGPLPIEIKRTYSSKNAALNDLGYGWLSGYPSYLVTAPDGTIQASDGSGAVIRFRALNGSGTWTAQAPDNPSMIGGSSGSTNLFNSYIQSAGAGYTWYLPDGSVRYYTMETFNMGTLPYLTRIVDNRGNYLAFSYGTTSMTPSYGRITQIQSSNGTSVNLAYVNFGLLSSVTASDGRAVTYTYSYGGDLTGVELPDGSTYSYQYGKDSSGIASNHLIAYVGEPDHRFLVNSYDSLNRVTQQLAPVGFGSATATLAAFSYGPNATTVTDADGQLTVYQYAGNLITYIGDPLGRSISQTWYTTTNGSGAYQNCLASVTDKRGLVTNYSYDTQGNIVSTVITGDLTGDGTITEAGTTATYDSKNRPISVTDASGMTTSYTYGDSNYPYLPTLVNTSKGGTGIRSDSMVYTSQGVGGGTIPFSMGLLAQKTTSFGSPVQSVTYYSYNPQGFLVQKTDATGTSDPNVVTTYTYTGHGELLTSTDGDGRTVTYNYDGMSRPVAKFVTDANRTLLGAWNTTYDGSGDVVQVVGPRSSPSNVEQWTYDGGGRVVQDVVTRIQAAPNGGGITQATAASTSYSVDPAGHLTGSLDPNGISTAYSCDADGEVVSKVTAGFRTELFQYEPGGDVSSYTNPLGGVTLKSYTSTGKLCQQQNPDGSVLQWLYYTDGRLQKEVLRNRSFWLVTYNDITQTVTRTLTRSDGTVLATETDVYDPRGNLVSHTDVDGNTTTTTYDGLNRVKTTTGPASTASSTQRTVLTSYGASAKTLVVQDGLGEATTTAYDAMGRPLQVQTASANGTSARLTTYAYSPDNNSVTIADGSGSGAVSRTVYSDYSGRTLLSVQGDGSFTYNIYDLNGNLLSSTNALNQTTSYAYNGLNQATTQTLPDGTVTTFTYDAAGNLLNRSMAAGSLDLVQTFDNAGRKLTESLNSGTSSTRQFSYAYYPSTSPWAGLLQTTTTPRSTVTVTYDDFLRPQNITTVGALPATNTTTAYAYDNRGLATSISQSSGSNAAGAPTQVTRGYDGYGNVISEAVTLGGQSISNVAQTWDAAGRRSSLNEASSSLPAPLFAYQHRADGFVSQVTANGQNYTFAYGDNGLVTSRTNPFLSVTIDSRDPVGRILQQTTTVNGATTMVEDMTWRNNSTLGSYSVEHSGAGAWNEARAYAYNSRGQLVSEGFSPESGVSNSVAYTFDGSNPGLGVRTDAKVGAGAPSQWEETATSTNGFAQVVQDMFPVTYKSFQANGIALGADHVNISVDGASQGLANFPGWTDPIGAWSANLNLPVGTHTLTAVAAHPSGLFTATATSNFTIAGEPGGNVANTFDLDGNITTRTWASGVTQTLTWDAFGRLVKVSQRDGSNNGYDWLAVYDGLGRRIQTSQQPVTAGTASGSPTITTSIYDPQVEFFEIGVALNGAKAWKVYGPDLNGHFGSLQGTGGLEATILDSGGTTQGVINDQFGNGVASVSGSTVSWFATRVGAYGPLPGRLRPR